ncbi:MAG TPA: FAD-dependent oxidoreductase [Caulobacteraceae bacterium]|nr:FAD-dependent oxidoreductase [Caulobacteraceae bacterium]
MAAGELVIIGAGPAGLSLSSAYAGPSRILERSGEVGGLCRSIEFGGGVFDIGGHSFHSPHPEVTAKVEALMRGRWTRQRREARVFFGGQLIAYPFQDHIDQIADPAIAAECRRDQPPPGAPMTADNFEDWIVERFGAGLARHFMLPYNRKLWARDLRRMSCDWVGERVAGAAADAPGPAPKRRPLTAEALVAYPADGGFGEIYRAMARQCGPIEFGRDIRRIDPKAKVAHAADGAAWAWERLVSTMPLPALLRAVDGCPAGLIAEADLLEYVSLKVLLVLVARPLADQPQRVYVADAAVPTHKIAFNHASSPALRGRPVHAVMCEIAHAPEKPLASEPELERATLDWLAQAGLIAARADVAETRWIDVEHGYPVYTHARPAIVQRIRAWLEPQAIHTIGRFGAWDYVNSDACIHQGMALAQRLG